MEVLINRIARVRPANVVMSYTIGHLYCDGIYVCDTLEPYDRGLDASMSLDDIRVRKVKGSTAIPTGTFDIDFKTWSPRFGSKDFYLSSCSGYLPRLRYVPGFDGILFHVGNTKRDTEGCILLGWNQKKGEVLYSEAAFKKWYRIVKNAAMDGEPVALRITRQYTV